MRLLVLDAPCRCGHPNPNRITEQERARYAQEDPSLFVGTFRCDKCRQVNQVTAGAYQRAVPLEPIRPSLPASVEVARPRRSCA